MALAPCNYRSKFSPTHGAYSDSTIKWCASELMKWLDDDENNFWLGDFAQKIGVHRNRFAEWSRKNPYFARAYEIAKQKQENRLFKGGLTQQFSANMAIFGLKNHHKWVDKTETTVNTAPVFNQIDQKKLEKMQERLENNVEEPEIVDETSNNSDTDDVVDNNQDES